MLAIHLLAKNSDGLSRALDSVVDLEARLVVGDLGKGDALATGRRYGAETISLADCRDRSLARNEMLRRSGCDWHLWLEPYEFIVDGKELIAEAIEGEPTAYRLQLLHKETMTKPVRLWANSLGLSFRNPVCESLNDVASSPLPVSLWAESALCEDGIAEWHRDKPASVEATYYMACLELSRQEYKRFAPLAERYIFLSKRSVSSTMMRYYLGMASCYALNKPDEAISQAVECLCEHPLMAEFWCLLADAHVARGELAKAREFYENAMLLGCKRLQDDPWPVHFSKYKSYPEEMIGKLNDI